MSNFKEKSQIFIIGLLVGLVVAGSFFVLKLDDYFKELNFYKSLSKTFSSDTKTDETVVKKENEGLLKEKTIPEVKSKNKKNVSGDMQKSDFILDADTLKTKELIDSSLIKSSAFSDDIVVHKDELLSTKTIEVLNLNPVADKMSAKDSLLQKVSGIKDDRSAGLQFFNIEFWQSPLNYKGYKMSKYKIVLYGITDVDGIKLYKSDEAIYLKSSAFVYKLDYASDFRQYERITDESIISKLK